MTTMEIFSDHLALTTPEISKMISDFSLFPNLSSQSGDMLNELSSQGLLSDYDEYDPLTIVSPNTACYGIDNNVDHCGSQQPQQQPTQHQHQQQQQVSGQQFVGQYHNDNGYSSGSAAGSPEPMIVNYENMTLNNFNMQETCAASPADSYLSTDSGASFYNLDQPVKIEPQDSTFPSMIDEINGQNQVPQQQQQQQQQLMMMQPVMQYNTQYTAQSQQQYQPIEQQAFGSYTESYMPTTVSNMQPSQVMIQQQQQQQPMTVTMAATSTLPTVNLPTVGSSAGRKRTATGAFASTSGEASVHSGNKKQRLTKRQKQQMMDKQVEEYTLKNKELREQIHLLERKVQFCTQFLQKYVSPLVQVQQNTWSRDVANAVSVDVMQAPVNNAVSC